MDGVECQACAESNRPCADCRRKIHESYHAVGLWWIRQEECHPDCPGLLPRPKPTTSPNQKAKVQDGQKSSGVIK
jgi:hypothetical protein